MVEGQGGAEVKGAFRSVQTPSAPSAEEEEVISTFGEFLMKAEQPVRGGGAGGRAGRRGQGRGAAVARLLAPGVHHQHVGGPAPDAGEIDTPNSLRRLYSMTHPLRGTFEKQVKLRKKTA